MGEPALTVGELTVLNVAVVAAPLVAWLVLCMVDAFRGWLLSAPDNLEGSER